jgi:hypothetical protein
MILRDLLPDLGLFNSALLIVERVTPNAGQSQKHQSSNLGGRSGTE